MSYFITTTTCLLRVKNCCVCNVTFALPQSMDEELRRTGAVSWCPNGHESHYTESENSRLKKERDLAIEKARVAESLRVDERLRRQREERRSAAARGHLTKLKRRIAHGVCPCCARTFRDLARHVAIKHPDWKKSNEQP